MLRRKAPRSLRARGGFGARGAVPVFYLLLHTLLVRREMLDHPIHGGKKSLAASPLDQSLDLWMRAGNGYGIAVDFGNEEQRVEHAHIGLVGGPFRSDCLDDAEFLDEGKLAKADLASLAVGHIDE